MASLMRVLLDWMFSPVMDGKPVASAIDAMIVTYAITMAGLPCISVAAVFTTAGLPVGTRNVGGRHAETVVLQATTRRQ